MRFDQVAVPLVPRTTSNCIDLAVAFARQHAAPIAALWAVIALPSCCAVFVLVDRYELRLPLAAVVFFFATSSLGVLLTTGAAPCVFGEPFTFRGTWSRLGWRGIGLLTWVLLMRCLIGLGLIAFLFPGWYVGVRGGFLVEQSALSKMSRHLHDRRADELLKGEIADLFIRSATIALFCGVLWLVLLFTADFASSRLFGFPLLLGRLQVDMSYLENLGDVLVYVAGFLWGDPIVLTAALAVAFAVYPLGRLAWFFCYIDVRVRRDCWDMELQIIQEAERLEAA